ncbi:MAG: hypothetical protein JO257_01870 [Deltaproteobacteria bacterium]|nr:hypothetical protein [Deltaproteobacteria bacterium]
MVRTPFFVTEPSMRDLFKLALVCAALALPTASRAGTSYNFPANTIIIPTNAAWQDDCGAVSAYGLVYDVLRANSWLDANGYGHITIYYIISDTKASPNRCLPTNLDTQPAGVAVMPSSGTCTGSCLTDSSWNDGCDITVTNSTGTPVKTLTFGAGTMTAGTTSSFNTTAKSNVSPRFSSRTINSSVTTVRYSGGPFVITGSDVTTFQNLMKGTIIAKDSQNNNIDFSIFRTFNASGTEKQPGVGDACTLATDNFVWIHQAQAAFTATIDKSFTQTPPRLALLAHDKNNTSGTNSGAPAGVVDGILEAYLDDAGLKFTGAGGCPSDGVNIANAAKCPTGAVNGQIYDLFDIQDLASSNSTTHTGIYKLDASNSPKYTMLWTPHWRLGSGTTPSAEESSALATVSSFLDGVNGASGLMGECAAISSYEGGSFAPSPSTLRLQTCAGTSSCTGTGTYQITATSTAPGFGGYYPNCSDVSVAANSSTNCAYYNVPSDPFAQIGEYLWAERYGTVGDFKPTAGYIYKPGVTPLVSKISGLGSRSHLTSYSLMYSSGEIDEDFATRNVKDNTSGKGNILYMGGHDQSAEVAGTKVVLETLLQLGFTTVVPPTSTFEVSRASPIVATISSQTAIVQGTFESVTPATTAKTVTTAADTASFIFPAVYGHMRARTAASVSTTASTFSSGTVLFDAANGIPLSTYTGCSSPFAGSCRSIFTTTATPSTTTGIALHPSRVMVDESNAATLGPLMVSGFTTAQAQAFIDRILAGVPNGAGGYTSKLGGVDRSTVAVVGASNVVSTTRPTMVYFGATDGMLHAVCGSVTGACDSLGRELWAFIPRTNLPYLRLNTARVDGSVRVFDAFGDFSGSGTKSFRTLLAFQTGWGDPTTSGKTPSVIEMDVTDPTNPTVVFEYTIPNPSSRGTNELGVGLTLGEGSVAISGTNTPVLFAETNNGGTAGAGATVIAINASTGAQIWKFGYTYPNPRTGGDSAVPATGIPGGAVPVDKTGQGLVTDVIFGDLYGDLWELDPATGASRYTNTGPVNKALFSFSTDYHAIGTPPAVYSNGGVQYAAFVSGGYADDSDTTWGSATQYLISVNLNTPTANATVNEASAATYVPIKVTLGAGEKGFAQALVVGSQLFVTTDNSDINSSTYGTTGTNTGHVYSYDVGSGTSGTTVVVAGGAGSIANSSTTLYAASSAAEQQLSTGATSATGTSPFAIASTKVTRALWLRTQ